MISLNVQIERLTGCPQPLDSDELSRRVAAELGELLERMPLLDPPPPGSVIRLPAGRVHTGSASTPAALAHAIARHLYTALQTAPPCPR